MQFVCYAIFFLVGVTLVAAFVQNLIHPPVPIDESDLPDMVQAEWNRYFPTFQPDEVCFLRARNRYVLTGKLDGMPGRLAFDLTPDDELAEVDYQEMVRIKTIQGKRKISATEIPIQLANIMSQFIDGDLPSDATIRAWSGRFSNEAAYEIKIRAGDWKYEFEITASGRLVEFEKEICHF